TDPDALPDPADPKEVQERLEEGLDLDRVEITRDDPEAAAGAPLDDEFDESEADLDLDTDYPTR
ncbi:hypothetical protein ACFQE1_13660, partial [Halobium palmae]